MFAELGYQQVWARMIAGLDGLAVASPTASALAQARRRVGATPLRALFDLLRGPATGPAQLGVWWRDRLVTAIDGTMLCCPDSRANLQVYRHGGSGRGPTGYPLIRLLALVACGPRTIMDATFGPDAVGELGYAASLVTTMRRGMIVLADRNFAAQALVNAIADTGADLLVRIKTGRRMPVCRRLGDGSYVSRIGRTEVRVITAAITVATDTGSHHQVYRLVTTVLEPTCPPAEIVALYHQRWEIETAYFELKSTILGGRVLRARTPTGVEQEIYALLTCYQSLRIAISDAVLTRPGLDPDRASFTIALQTARDQLIHAHGVIAEAATSTAIDLVGMIGRRVIATLLPPRRHRSNPRVVKRAISVYAANSSRGRARAPSSTISISIEILDLILTAPPAS